MENEKVFFKPGDLVKCKLTNSPVMLVICKEQTLFKRDNQRMKGLRCRWFTSSGLLQEAVFNTLDLIKLE